MYDGLLRSALPCGVKIVGFADDIVLVATGESLEKVEILATEAVDRVEDWMSDNKLSIAHQKTEMVVISNRKSAQKAKITVGGHTIESKRELKHLGVMIDDRLSFTKHVDYACKKAAKTIAALTRIMPNSSAIRGSKRRLIASVVTSTLCYGGPVWAPALKLKRNQERLNSTIRLMCMRIASAYRTISSEAAHVIAGMIPINLRLEESVECYRLRGTTGARKAARENSLRKWQQLWDNATKGRWTYRLIPNVVAWTTRKHGEVNFYLTQFLSGHGCFRKYLHRFGHAESALCPSCGETEETPEHVVFECPRFESARNEWRNLGEEITLGNVIQKMCDKEEVWSAVSRAITHIMSALQSKWSEDQRMAGSSGSS